MEKCPYPAHPDTVSHYFVASVLEGLYLVLHCSQCGRMVWPQGVRDPNASVALRTTIANPPT